MPCLPILDMMNKKKHTTKRPREQEEEQEEERVVLVELEREGDYDDNNDTSSATIVEVPIWAITNNNTEQTEEAGDTPTKGTIHNEDEKYDQEVEMGIKRQGAFSEKLDNVVFQSFKPPSPKADNVGTMQFQDYLKSPSVSSEDDDDDDDTMEQGDLMPTPSYEDLLHIMMTQAINEAQWAIRQYYRNNGRHLSNHHTACLAGFNSHDACVKRMESYVTSRGYCLRHWRNRYDQLYRCVVPNQIMRHSKQELDDTTPESDTKDYLLSNARIACNALETAIDHYWPFAEEFELQRVEQF